MDICDILLWYDYANNIPYLFTEHIYKNSRVFRAFAHLVTRLSFTVTLSNRHNRDCHIHVTDKEIETQRG